MVQNIYALLVGIDEYPNPYYRLNGCVQDMMAWCDYLQTYTATTGQSLHLRTLQNAEATRQSIIDGFRNHLGQATADDLILFTYSGHGSQKNAAPDDAYVEPDGKNETFVCWDSRTAFSYDLLDKEMAYLIAEVARACPNIVLIIDCCHSESIDRDINVRRIEPDNRPRPAETLLGYRQGTSATRSLEISSEEWIVPRGRHITLSACRDVETAKEISIDGSVRGIFSYYLLETLNRQIENRQTEPLTYQELFDRVRTLIANENLQQTPVLQRTHAGDENLYFLGNEFVLRQQAYTISYLENYGWVMNSGCVHGLLPASQAHVLIFSYLSTNFFDSDQAIGTASVVDTLAHLSRLEPIESEQLNQQQVYRGVVYNFGGPKFGVYLQGNAAGMSYFRQTIEQSDVKLMVGDQFKEVSCLSEARFQVFATDDDDKYVISDVLEQRSLPELEGFSRVSATVILIQFTHILQWDRIRQLNNPEPQLPEEVIQWDIYQGQELQNSNELVSVYQDRAGTWRASGFRMKLTNTSDSPLYCAVLNLGENYSVDLPFFEAGGVWLNAGETSWACNGRTFYTGIPDELLAQGINQYQDILKLVVCSKEFDTVLLTMPKVTEVAQQIRENIKSSQVQTSDRYVRELEPDAVNNWYTQQITITTIHP